MEIKYIIKNNYENCAEFWGGLIYQVHFHVLLGQGTEAAVRTSL